MCLSATASYAQQTVFNVPNADVSPPKVIFLQHESQFKPYNPNAFWLGTHYSTLGIGHNTELTGTLFNLGAPNTNNIALGIGFKSAIPILKEKYPKREFKITAGSEILVSLDGNGTGNWSYSHVSARIPKLNTRLTSGISFGTKQVFGENKICFIGAIEQPVTKKLTLIADWYSGNEHSMGYLITGFGYELPKGVHIYAGYQIPNSSKAGEPGFVVEMSKSFDLNKKLH